MNSEIIIVRRLVSRLLRSWPILIVAALIWVILAIITITISPSFYNSRVSIMVEQPYRLDDPQRWILSEQRFNEPDRSYTVNEGIRMKEFGLVLKTVERLNLGVKYFEQGLLLNTEIFKTNPFTVQVDFNSELEIPYGVEFLLVPTDQQTFRLKANDEYGPSSITIDMDTVVSYGERLNIGGASFVVRLVSDVSFDPERAYGFLFQNLTEVALDLVDDINVDPAQLEGSIFIAELTTTPEHKANDILDALSTIYVEQKIEERMTVLKSIHQTILEQIELAATKLSRQEADIESYKSNQRLNSVEGESRSMIEELIKLKNELRQLEMRDQYLSYLGELVNSFEKDQSLAAPGAYDISDPVLNQLVVDYNNLIIQQNSINSLGQNEHPAFNMLRMEIESKAKVITQTVSGFRSTNKIHLDNIKAEISSLESRSSSLPYNQMELLRKDREFNSLDLNYRALSQKKSEVEVAMASLTANIAVVDKAHQTTAILAVFVVLFTLLSPFVFLFFKTLFSTTISDVEFLKTQLRADIKCFFIGAAGRSQIMKADQSLSAFKNTSSMLSWIWTNPKKHKGRIIMLNQWDDQHAQEGQLRLIMSLLQQKRSGLLTVRFSNSSADSINLEQLISKNANETNALIDDPIYGKTLTVELDMTTADLLQKGTILSDWCKSFDVIILVSPSMKTHPETGSWGAVADDIILSAEFGKTSNDNLDRMIDEIPGTSASISVVVFNTPPSRLTPQSVWQLFKYDGISIGQFGQMLLSRI
jgi:uncharacterized protein involved in exopolysaccharide biosynthesis